MRAGRANGSIVYSFATPQSQGTKPIYVNLIPRFSCPNSCRFCSRNDAVNGRSNIYERKAGTSLYLSKPPKAEDIIREVRTLIVAEPAEGSGFKHEIAFVGLGEPLMQFDLVCEVMRGLGRVGHKDKIRVDTDGLIKCMAAAQWSACATAHNDPALVLKEAGLTDIRISVNATNSNEYEALCRPRFQDAFENLRSFVLDCIYRGIDTCVSFVVGFDDGVVKTRSKADYIEFATTSFGLGPEKILLREHMPPTAK